MHLTVTTPRGYLVQVEAEEIVAPGVLGEFGILPGHIPFMSVLKPGVLSYRGKDGTKFLAVGDGILQIARVATATRSKSWSTAGKTARTWTARPPSASLPPPTRNREVQGRERRRAEADARPPRPGPRRRSRPPAGTRRTRQRWLQPRRIRLHACRRPVHGRRSCLVANLQLRPSDQHRRPVESAHSGRISERGQSSYHANRHQRERRLVGLCLHPQRRRQGQRSWSTHVLQLPRGQWCGRWQRRSK
jgi:hypothetical protein